MQKKDARASFCLKSGFKHMHRKAIDVVDHTRADSEWKRRIAIGRNTVRIGADVTREPSFFLDVELHSRAFSKVGSGNFAEPLAIFQGWQANTSHNSRVGRCVRVQR